MTRWNRRSSGRISNEKSRTRKRSRPLGRVLLSCAVFFALPGIAFASVQITEIMYDLPGGDSGREWIEITNTGSQPIDISHYRLGEGTTNHLLVVVSGSTTLPAGSSAIIADDPAMFKTDWPAFSGTLFNSTFSLSNTGENLSIKNAVSVSEDSVSYASGMGAAGDGGSLQRSGATFMPALPTPGMFPGELRPVPVAVKSAPAEKSPTASTKPKTTKLSAQAAAVAEAPRDTFDPSAVPVSRVPPMTLWILGLIGIISLGTAGAVFAWLMLEGRVPGVTNEKAGEFQIIEG
jgi:hypothetical protein